MLYKKSLNRFQKIFGLTALLLALSLDGCNSTDQIDQSSTVAPSTPSVNSTPSTPTVNSTPTNSSSTSNPVATVVEHPLVVATDTIICGLAQKIAVDTVDLKCLATPDSNQNNNQPKPEDIQAIEQAKLILYSNDNLAPSLSTLIQTTGNTAPKVVVDDVALTHTQQLQLEAVNNFDASISEKAINILEIINKSLSELQPNLASIYTTNTQKITNELTQINSGSQSGLAKLSPSQRQLVITRELLAYLNPTSWPNINPRARLARVPVIMYHDILPKKQVFFDVTQQEFEEHLQRLQSSGVTPISVNQLVTHLRTGLPLPKKPILLTFDDGYESAYQYVFPLLKKYNYPAAFAIYTLNVGKNTGRDHVTWEQLREMAASPLVTIMAHSITHPNDLTTLPDEQLKAEVLESKHILETQLGIPICYFVYPAGRYDSRAEKLVQQGGYEAAFTMNDLKDRFAEESKDLLAIDRIGQSRLPYAVTQAWGGPKLSSWAQQVDLQSSEKVTKKKATHG
jgi:peptidoglycan/xylan/chitin deacetylase (PgdA/CDA1 family)/ABC-type Zn uptake system ZnuABC Zn-binding protein ZnuA